MKKILGACLITAALGCNVAAASPLVTADVPLDSNYYLYLDKLEGMGYVTDIPTGTKPYSRLDMAKWLLQAEAVAKTKPMPKYLQTYYDTMRADLAEEIAYLSGENDKFESNLKLRTAKLDFSYLDQDKSSQGYKLSPNNGGEAKEFKPAHWQMLNHNNNGYRYGDGFNAVGSLNISGSINKDFALGITPRFSWDKDEHGDASLIDGYVKTHVGVWGVTVGKQPLTWGQGANGTLAFSNNATPQTMAKLNLLEPHTFDNGVLKFLGKANVNVFASQLEGNRVETSGDKYEKDHAPFIGIRVDVMPTDALTIGLERMSMLRKFNKDWFLGDNAESSDAEGWNDIAGFDVRYRFPGVQLYGSLYGEDQAHAFPCEDAYTVGLYFPQLVQDGSWDLRLEGSQTNTAWYRHWVMRNGWTYKDDIMGDWIGNDARKYYAQVNHYLDNGDRVGLSLVRVDMNRSASDTRKLSEVQVDYSTKLLKDMYLDTSVGYGKFDDSSTNSFKSKRIAAGVRWEF